MSTSNSYATLADFLAYVPNSGNVVTANAENALDAVTEQFFTEVGLYFYPVIETRYFDTPQRDELWVGNNLLEVLTLTNGDGNAITAAEYKLWPYNLYPKSSINLLPLGSTFYNQATTSSWEMAAIALSGIWGYHRKYAQAWATGTTLSAAMTTTTGTSWTVTASTAFAAGNISRVDNELILITATGTGTLTATRGWNGSTAATHLNAAPVTIWTYPPDIKRACLIQAARLYRRSETVYGTQGGGEMGVQPVTIPELDPDVKKILSGYRDMVP